MNKIVLLIMYIFLSASSNAEEIMNAEEIVEKLSLHPKNRGLVLEKKVSAAPTLTFNNILFDYDSYRLNQSSYPVLNEIGKALSSNDLNNNKFEIIGHTDSKGDEIYNQKLSTKRAHAVVNYLVTNYGISSINMIAVGKGKSSPLKDMDSADSRNRRVEIRNITNKE